MRAAAAPDSSGLALHDHGCCRPARVDGGCTAGPPTLLPSNRCRDGTLRPCHVARVCHCPPLRTTMPIIVLHVMAPLERAHTCPHADAQSADPVVEKLYHSTEEGKKVSLARSLSLSLSLSLYLSICLSIYLCCLCVFLLLVSHLSNELFVTRCSRPRSIATWHQGEITAMAMCGPLCSAGLPSSDGDGMHKQLPEYACTSEERQCFEAHLLKQRYEAG